MKIEGEWSKLRSENPAISIILPTYNVSKYITFCVDSILQQTFQDFELIIIDDSTDDTYEICQRLYGKLEGVRLYKNPIRKGIGYARNVGVTYGKGKYVYFMDSDDELLPWSMECFFKKAEEEQADVVHTNLWCNVYSDGRMMSRTYLWKKCGSSDIGVGKIEGKSPSDKVLWQAHESMPMPWLNLYKKEFLIKEGINFPEMALWEDNIHAVEVIIKAKKYVRINEALYLYRCYFDQKERMLGRLKNCFSAMPKVSQSFNRMFSVFPEEEFPSAVKRSIISERLMAFLICCIFNVMSTDDNYDFERIKQYFQPPGVEENDYFVYLLYIIEKNTGIRELIDAREKEKIDSAKKFFLNLDSGESSFAGIYSYIYTEAKLAVNVEGGEDDFYCKAYECLADAALKMALHEEAVEAYDKAIVYAAQDSEEFLRMAGKRLTSRNYLGVSDKELVKVYDSYFDALGMVDLNSCDISVKKVNSRKIRLGVLSADFSGHDMFLLYYGLLFCYNKEQFEVFCYNCGRVEDDYTGAVRNQVDKFTNVGELSYKERAETIYEDKIDVLIELAEEHLEETMPVFAYKPASLQIAESKRLPFVATYLFDYYLVDNMTMPLRAQKEWNRKFLHMPCCVSYALRNDAEPSYETPAVARQYITFGAVLHYRQISDRVITLWREILDRVPGARLLIKADEFAEKSMMMEAAERFQEAGFDLKRVQCQGIGIDPLLEYRDIDICLGTYPVYEVGQLLNSLYMGVPVVAYCDSGNDASRCRSVLSKVGLDDFVTNTGAEYIDKAVELASSLKKLNVLHKNLRGKVKVAAALKPAEYMRRLEMSLLKLYNF